MTKHPSAKSTKIVLIIEISVILIDLVILLAIILAAITAKTQAYKDHLQMAEILPGWTTDFRLCTPEIMSVPVWYSNQLLCFIPGHALKDAAYTQKPYWEDHTVYVLFISCVDGRLKYGVTIGENFSASMHKGYDSMPYPYIIGGKSTYILITREQFDLLKNSNVVEYTGERIRIDTEQKP